MTKNETYYYPINEESARAAKQANSFSDYVENSATKDYQSMVDIAVEIAEKQKECVDPSNHEKIDNTLERYCHRLAENINNNNRICASVPSIMIAGGSNFPVRKKEKQNQQLERNYQEYKAIQGLLDKIKSIGTGGISSDDKNATDKLKEKLESLQSWQAQAKEVNKYYRTHGTCVGFTGISEERAKDLDETARSYHGKPYPSFSLSNNNQNMSAIKKRIASLENVQNIAEDSGWKFENGEVVLNKEENRVQLLFDEKPSEEMRSKLKSHGFKWAPSQKAWQRMLNGNGIYAAKRVTSTMGKSRNDTAR